MFRKPQRVADSVTGGEPSHLMGSHPLFENGCTVKRFPFLASLPQQEVVELFHVEPVNGHDEKQQDLYAYHEPYVDQKIVFRTAASGKKPFKPTNAAAARSSIRGGTESVYFGTYENKTIQTVLRMKKNVAFVSSTRRSQGSQTQCRGVAAQYVLSEQRSQRQCQPSGSPFAASN